MKKKIRRINPDIFSVTPEDAAKVMAAFQLEMKRGLSGKKSSLKMIPAYVSRPTGMEKGEFIALDLGGTHFRILKLALKGNGRIGTSDIMKFVLGKRHITGNAGMFFGFIADCVKSFLVKYGLDSAGNVDLGFTFSFPVKLNGVASGTLICWTKGFRVKGVIGEDVVRLFKEALNKKGINNIEISALANDTVGTLMAKSYSDRNCDIAVIIGTGTNACYAEKIKNIVKLPERGRNYRPEMIINTEWGNFNKLSLTAYDKIIDKNSNNPGKQILEKMVSGMYLGRLVGLVLKDAFGFKGDFKSEYMSAIESDNTNDLSVAARILKKAGIAGLSLEDRRYIKDVCRHVSGRAARLSAACMAAIIKKIDPALSRNHTIAIDGSVYEKHPTFKRDIRSCLKEIFRFGAARIHIVLAKDGSGKGAAIIAAVAAAPKV